MKYWIFILLLMVNTTFAQENRRVNNGTSILSTTVYAPEKSETVLLLHGGPGVPDPMLEVVNILKANYRVITFEQRGVGASVCKKCSYTIADYTSDIDAILNAFQIEKVHLFGHSWGGLYAQIYANERPEKMESLFLCSPSSGTNSLWKQTEKEVMQFNKQQTTNGEWLSMGWNSLLGLLGSDKAYTKVFQQVLKNYHKPFGEIQIDTALLNRIHARPINKTRKEIVQYPPLPEFTQPEYPVQITYGEHDIYGERKNQLIQRFPTAQIQIISNCGHIPWKHNPTALEDILNAFYL
tara:strand:- start:2242 stop:3126 length:885 start_codon:yes stop_codon:yes gene_type:complete